MIQIKNNEIICAMCGTGIVGQALYDTNIDIHLCDRDCYLEWSHHFEIPIEHYESMNIVVVDEPTT